MRRDSDEDRENEIGVRIDVYVQMLKASGSLKTASIEDAFRKVERHRLVDRFFAARKDYSSTEGYDEIVHDPDNPKPEHLDLIYSHRALVTRLGPNGMPTSSTSMPALVANMLELLRVERGQKVLEIGAGTGYNAALIAEIVGDARNVVTVDIQEDVVAQAMRLLGAAGYGEIKVLARDGFFGAADYGPFDRIIATVGCFDVSPHWLEQLASRGEALIPLYQGGSCPLMRVHKENGQVLGHVVGGSGFMPIQGEMAVAQSRGLFESEVKVTETFRPAPLWEKLEPGMGGKRYDFWFFASASDSRASLLPMPGEDDTSTWTNWTFGLAEKGARVVVGRDELLLVGKAESLLERLDQLHELWESAGRPSAFDFDVEFIKKSDGMAPTPEALAIERKYHWQVLRLPNPHSTA